MGDFERMETLVRDHLHMVFHCVFHHASAGASVEIPLGDLVCDIAAEAAIGALKIQRTSAKRSAGRQSFMSALRAEARFSGRQP